MKLLTPALLAATALSVTLPAAAQAQAHRDCETERQNRQIAGALIGGVLGAVIGNELADDSNNNRHGRPDRWDRRGRWDDRGRHGYGRHGRWDRRYQHRDRGNAEEVGTIAGAGVGALIGAGIAGGEDCHGTRHTRHDPYAGKPAGHYGDSRYEESYYDDGHYSGGYAGDTYYAPQDYGQDYGSSAELLGGPDGRTGTRVYTASSSYSTRNCQWMNGGVDRMYMCQGTDGIWRPADTYGR